MKTWGLAFALFMFSAGTALAVPPAPAKISISKKGKITYNGKPITLAQLKPKLKALKKADGSVWYYREEGKGEPPAAAMDALKLIMKCKLTLVMSSKKNFSDVVSDQSLSKLE